LSSRLLSKNLKIRVFRAIILSVALHGCENWSLTLREEHRLRRFGTRVPRRIFGPRRDDVTGDGENCITRSIFFLYSSPSIIRIITPRRMRWTGHVARMGENRNVYKLLVGKSEV
jgi:hypothetical protein